MKYNILIAALFICVTAFNTAYADSIQVDLNGDSVLTPAFDELSVDYDSHTLVNVINGSVHTYAGTSLIGNDILGLGEVYSDFDDMTSLGGVNTFSSAPDTNFLRLEEGGTIALKDTYLSFGVDLIGTFNPALGIIYTSGTLDLWQGYTDGVTAPVKVMTATFSSGGLTVGNQDILSLSSAPDIKKDGVMFFDQSGSPISFEDYLDAHPLSVIRLLIDQNVTGGAESLIAALGGSVEDGFKGADGQGNVYISANHNASLTFNVPEPTSLAILGIGLLSLARSVRRNN